PKEPAPAFSREVRSMPSIQFRSTPKTVARAVAVGVACTLTAGAILALAQVAKSGKRPEATPVERLKGLKGFRVERPYNVPREEQGSWVSLTVDPKGRLIASDQYGKLFRVTTPSVGGPVEGIKVEPIPVDIGEAQGLLWAFDSLYVVVNPHGK